MAKLVAMLRAGCVCSMRRASEIPGMYEVIPANNLWLPIRIECQDAVPVTVRCYETCTIRSAGGLAHSSAVWSRVRPIDCSGVFLHSSAKNIKGLGNHSPLSRLVYTDARKLAVPRQREAKRAHGDSIEADTS